MEVLANAIVLIILQYVYQINRSYILNLMLYVNYILMKLEKKYYRQNTF